MFYSARKLKPTAELDFGLLWLTVRCCPVAW